jgi:hypothetical protein
LGSGARPSSSSSRGPGLPAGLGGRRGRPGTAARVPAGGRGGPDNRRARTPWRFVVNVERGPVFPVHPPGSPGKTGPPLSGPCGLGVRGPDNRRYPAMTFRKQPRRTPAARLNDRPRRVSTLWGRIRACFRVGPGYKEQRPSTRLEKRMFQGGKVRCSGRVECSAASDSGNEWGRPEVAASNLHIFFADECCRSS